MPKVVDLKAYVDWHTTECEKPFIDTIDTMIEILSPKDKIEGPVQGVLRQRVVTLLNINYAAGGLSGEAGEVAEKIKKVLRDNEGVFNDEIRLAIIKELGDVVWYVQELADLLGFDLFDVLGANMTKLDNRALSNTIHGNGDER